MSENEDWDVCPVCKELAIGCYGKTPCEDCAYAQEMKDNHRNYGFLQASKELQELAKITDYNWRKGLKAAHWDLSNAFLDRHAKFLVVELKEAVERYEAILKLQKSLLDVFEVVTQKGNGARLLPLDGIWEALPLQGYDLGIYRLDILLTRALDRLEVQKQWIVGYDYRKRDY